jgi:retron-type reverse transcriptase
VKRQGNLYTGITSFENLHNAAREAQKSKRYRDNVLAFNYDLERNIVGLQEELQTRTYRPGPFRSFIIHDPKRRLISAAPYRDRIVHHAVCQVVAPILERTYIHDSYANRENKGTHRALQRFGSWCRRFRYVFQADIRMYFPSIDHDILKEEIRRKIKCPDTLWLLDTIIDHSNPQEDTGFDYFPGDDLFSVLRRKGIPIGNLTSQHFANIYLNRFDHFVKEKLGCGAYLRYVDDFALFSDSRTELTAWRCRIERQLEILRLRIHPIKSQIVETRKGASFVGFRILPDRVRVVRKSVRRARSRFRSLESDYAGGRIGLAQVKASILSWIAHVSHADSHRLREKMLSPLVFQRQA